MKKRRRPREGAASPYIQIGYFAYRCFVRRAGARRVVLSEELPPTSNEIPTFIES